MSLSGSDTTDVCCELISLTVQHVKLYLMLFALPAGWKTAQHVELYLIHFIWLIMSLMLSVLLSLSRTVFYGCMAVLTACSSTFDLAHTWIYTRMRIVKDVRRTIHIDIHVHIY